MTRKKTGSDGGRLYLLVQHLARTLRHLDIESGISPARFSALAHLAFHGVDNVGQLAAAERVSRPAMTRLVRDMEKSGLVSRRVDPRDGRAVLVQLTEKGRAAIDRAQAAKIAFVSAKLESLDGKSRRAVRIALKALGH